MVVNFPRARRQLCLSAFLSASALLSACGGGSGGPSPTSFSNSSLGTSPYSPSEPTGTQPNSSPNPSSTPPTDTPAPITTDKAITIIEYHGDSTVWGYRSGSGDRVAIPAPAAFAAALPTPERYVVHNRGVNSADACELLDGRNSRYSQPWETYMAASDADIVIINHAINDQWRMTIDRYRSCLNSLASIAKRHGKKVIFETPNPTLNSYPGGLGLYADAMKSVASAQDAAVIDQHAFWMNRLNGDYRNHASIIPDGLHPDEATYIAKGRYAAEVFGKLAG